MTLANIAGIIGGGILGLIIGLWWGWAARTHSITRQGYTVFTVAGQLYIVRSAGMAEALESMNAKMDSQELRIDDA
jgi:hypothetical protein